MRRRRGWRIRAACAALAATACAVLAAAPAAAQSPEKFERVLAL